MKNLTGLLVYLLTILAISCSGPEKQYEINLENKTNLSRNNEIADIPLSRLVAAGIDTSGVIIAEDAESGKLHITQLSDRKSDGNFATLLIQVDMDPISNKRYIIRNLREDEEPPSAGICCFSRFVPERTDDYAWENDRVAFRTYGPEAQRMNEAGNPAGTLSSGIDCWLKKVDYLIIDKWYRKNSGGGSYHEDDGEGLDNFHVGISRGCGGTCFFDRATGTSYRSKNYSQWKKIEDGTLRASFDLKYEPWTAGDRTISERKHISLDKGSNLTRYEIEVSGSDELTAGLTMHEKDGVSTINSEEGWFSYWQPHGESELGMAIVVDPEYLLEAFEYLSDEKELSHLYVKLRVIDGKVIYYSGFAWKESNQYPTKESWEAYLSEFAEKLNSPLTIKTK